MLRCDDKIKQSLEIRDRKMSPVVKQTKEQALALQETLNQSAYLSNNSRVLSPEQKMKLALPLKQMVTESDPVVRTEQNSQRDSRWNLLTKESPGSGMLRYLNPRCLQKDSSAFKEPRSAAKLGTSPLRHRQII